MGINRGRGLMICTSGGREFQSWGAERLKAGLPRVLRQEEGTARWMEEEDVREQDGVVTWRRSGRGRGEVGDGLE